MPSSVPSPATFAAREPRLRGQGVTAVLGPTNTGKTFLAIERMLAHSSGIIGLPLRLLAREVYNKVVARAGVENLTMTLAVEWSQFGILVNAVAPGIILSSGTAQYPPQLLERGIKETPLKRAGTVDEVAASILFLASPAAQYITGHTLNVNGGMVML